MSSVVVETADALVRWKMAERNVKRLAARDLVAADARIAPGALRRLFNGSLKRTTDIGRALDDLFIETTRKRIAALEHELALAMARAEDQRPLDVGAVEAALATARSLISGA